MKSKVLSLLLAVLLLTGLVLPIATFADGETYTVSFAPGTGTGSMDSATVNAGDSYTLPACGFTHTNSERVFYKWSVGGERKDPGDPIIVSADTTVTALWVYTASSSLVNHTQDNSTTNYVGKLVMTDTRTGTTTTEALYDETASSTYTQPMNSDVASMSGNCVSTLMTALYSYPNANFISDDKPTLAADHAEVVDSWNHITYRFEEAPDEAGDYVRTMYMEGDYGNAWRFTETVTGEYISPTYTVTVSTAIHGSVSADKASAAEGETVTLTVTPDTDYELKTLTVKDASDNPVSVTDNSFTMPAGNVTVTASFKPVYRNLALGAAAGGHVDALIGDHLEPDITNTGGLNSTTMKGASVTLTATPDSGYTFKGWYRGVIGSSYFVESNDGTLISASATYSFTLEVNTNLQAVFEEDATPLHHYDEIQVWIGDAAGNTPGDAFTGGKVAVSYTPSYDDYPEDVAAKDGAAFEHGQIFGCYVGDEVTLCAQPDSGYRFVGWYLADGAWPAHGPEKYTGDMLSDQTSYSFELSSTNRLICAVFEALPPSPATYTVNVTNDGNGTGSASPASGTAGTEITLTAAPNEGCRLKEWEVVSGGVTVADSKFTLGSADVEIKAIFEAIPTYTVTFNMDGGSSVPDQPVAEGSKAAKPTDPIKEDSIFDGWYGDSDFSAAFDFNAPVTADAAIYAKWKKADYVLTAITGTTEDASHTWTKGSTGDVMITVKLNDGVDHSFARFTGVQIDGTTLENGTDYTAREGSTIVTLKAATLERLSSGVRAVTILFDNGQVNSTLTIKAASRARSSSSPATGDGADPGLWLSAMVVSASALAVLAAADGSRRRASRQ